MVDLDDDLSPYALATGAFNIPNSALSDILDLLTGGNFSPVPELQTENNKAHIRGIYELCALWIGKPILYLGKGPAPKGAIKPGPAFSWGDACYVWNLFRLGEGITLASAADTGLDESAATPPISDDVSDAT
jgi:hypothetical protein